MTKEVEKTGEEIIFKPKYPGRIKISVILYPIGLVACLYCIYMAITSGKFVPYGIYAFIFGFTILSMPMIIFREIRIEDAIIVKRYFLPKRVINFEDVVQLTGRGLVAKRGGIPLVNVLNRDEFEKIIKKLAAQKKIKLKK